MRDLEFPDNFFHGLWACASFIHMKKKHAKKTLQGFFRVLKPGGILYMSVKKGKGEKQVSKPYYKTEKKRFMSFYEKEEIKKLVEDSGFKTIKISENKGESSHWIVVFAVKAGTHE